MDAVRQLILDRVPNLSETSKKIGKNHAYLQQFVHRGVPAKLPEDVRAALAPEMGVSPEDLRPVNGKTSGTGTVVDRPNHATHAQRPPSGAIPAADLTGERDLPVFGIAQGGRGALILSSEPVDHVLRPDPLLRVKDGYGVIVTEDSMAPEFRSGDIALVNPHLPPRAGDTCIFRHQDEDGSQVACIKFLRRATATAWLVTEWNSDDGGPREFSLKRSEWQLAHVTVGNYKRR